MPEEQSTEKAKEKRSKSQKSRRDVAVQGTNDNSIVSKCSMARQGYVQDDYLQYFVSKVTRRAPLIHRGYYIRARVVEHLVHKFLGSCEGPYQIVSLGAGYDAAFFRLYKQGRLAGVTYCEVDFPDLVRRKRTLIEANPEMLAMIGESRTEVTQKSPHIELCCRQYMLLGVDLTQGPTLEAAMRLAGLTFDLPTLLLSECVLTYIHHKSASNIIRWSSEVFTNSVFVLYEQILPYDPFGLFMQKHFHTIGSPLKCLNHYPTLQAQIDRCKKQGWERVQALDMNGFYNILLSAGDRSTVESLEPFDEHEEWHLKCAHYFVLCAHQGPIPSLLNDLDWHPDESSCANSPLADHLSLHKPAMTGASVKRFAHSLTSVGLPQSLTVTDQPYLVVCGGFGEQQGKHQRVTEATLVDTRTYQTWSVPIHADLKTLEVCRLHATATRLSDGRILLIGGRQSPMKICSQMIAITTRLGHTPHNDMTDQHTADTSGVNGRSNTSSTNKSTSNLDTCNPDCDKNVMQVMTSENCECSVGMSNLENGLSVDCRNSGPTSSVDIGASSHGENIFMVIDSTCETVLNCVTGSQVCGSEASDEVTGGTSVQLNMTECVEPGVEISCSVIQQTGEVPCSRWRHTAVLYQDTDGEKVLMFGGRTQSQFATKDCFFFNPATTAWDKIETTGALPAARHSQTADLWQGHMVIAGGLGDDLQPLTSVHLLDLSSHSWSQLPCDIEPRYSHCSHVIGDFLILIGGVNLSHNPPGVAIVHLPSGTSREFSLPVADKERLLMLHNFTSHHLGDGRILLLGGGGNCFSFGTHLNVTPVILDVEHALTHMLQTVQVTK